MTCARPRRLLALLGALAAALVVVGLAPVSALAQPQPNPVPTRAAAPAQDGPTGATVLVGTGGIIWSDVDRDTTPRLWELLRDGSGAALTVRSVNTSTCPVDAWLGVSAGERAAAPAATGNPRRASWEPCPDPAPVVDGVVSEWDEYLEAAAQLRFNSTLGTLGDAAADQGVCISAVGPGAALGAARGDGTSERVAAYDPATLPQALTSCPITLVDVGSLSQSLPDQARTDALTEIDTRIGAVLDAAPAGANVIVASMADDGTQSRLRMAVATGPGFGAGLLLSPSTRQPGLVVNNDLTSSVLGLTGLEVPRSVNGGVLTSEAAPVNSEELAQERLQDLVDYDLASHKIRSLVPPFFQAFVYGQLVIYALVLLVWKGKLGSRETRGRWLGLARVVAISAAAVPAATFLANLIPWWRTSWPMLAVVVSVATWTAIIAVLALCGPWGSSGLGPVAVVSAVTVLVLGIDVMTGSRLQLSSLMGLQPAIGGRYFGLGNVPFALFITSAIFLATVVANAYLTRGRRKAAAWAAGLILTAALIVNGAPMWGADAGGPLSLTPAIAFLVLTILGIKITWQRWILLFAATGAIFLSVAFLDSLRPLESQSHLGRFIGSISDGNALDIIVRKAEQNWNVLTGNYTLTLLVPFALAFVIYVLARETSWGSRALQRSFDRYPALRPGLLTTLLALTVGFFVNDSGVAIPAVGATIAVPLLIAINVWVLRQELLIPNDAPAEPTDTPTPATRGARHRARGHGAHTG
ncbi:MAG: hypothetical protein LC679_10595 [Intrasporangiaceae bacterium]|nr:hypothetical protein [Intrasporangiaceae bacterium]